MAEPATVARPYAEAAFKLALDEGSLEAWSYMLAAIEAAVTTREIVCRIGDPNTSDHALESVLLGALGERLDAHGRNLVQLLVRNGRLQLVSQIRALYEALRQAHDRMTEVKVISAKPIPEQQLQLLVTALQSKYGGRITAQVEVDPELIGGARILVGDKVIDATVRGRLDAMAAALTH